MGNLTLKTLGLVLLWAFLCSILYAGFSFINVSVSPDTWGMDTRFMYVLMCGVAGIAIWTYPRYP